MAENFDTTATKTAETPWIRRVSWGAILAGVFVALGIQLTLTFLGLSIGFATISPYGEQNPAGTTIGAVVWFIITGIISLFAGGWVTGRLSGEFHRIDKILNGLVLWGIVVSASLYLMTTTATSLLGGAFGLLGTGISATGQAATQAVPYVDQLLPGSPLADLQDEAQRLIRQAQEASPEERQAINRDIGIISQALNKLIREGQLSQGERENVSNVLAARSDMSQQQADSTVNTWVQSAQAGREEILKQADAATTRASQASLTIFFILLLDALAAAFGSAVSKNPDHPPAASAKIPYKKAA